MIDESWTLGPFVKADEANPVLGACADSRWTCHIAGDVAWEEKDVFNPAAVVKDGQVHLLYRAEDKVGKFLGTSRIGLARSSDGVKFTREGEPVLYPADDANHVFEWEGGCEDPRVCSSPHGGYVMTYTAYDGVKARLCVATSTDLRNWAKHGLAFPDMPDLWSKSGSIVCRLHGDDLVATRIHGQYWMYWGESYIFAATSDDLIRWKPVVHPTRQSRSDIVGMPGAPEIQPTWQPRHLGVSAPEREALVAVARPRKGRFDSDLVEPGPPAVLVDEGIVLIYNGKNLASDGDDRYPPGTYCAGQLLLDAHDPTSVIARVREPFLWPDREYEITGQVGNVCFAEGLASFQGEWLLYYGTADSKIAVAATQARG